MCTGWESLQQTRAPSGLCGAPSWLPRCRPDSVAPPPGRPGTVPTVWRSFPAARAPGQGDLVLTEVVRVAEVEDVTAVHVMVQGLLNQVLRLVPGQLCHPREGRQLLVSYTALRLPFIYSNVGFANESDEKRLGGVVDVGN